MTAVFTVWELLTSRVISILSYVESTLVFIAFCGLYSGVVGIWMVCKWIWTGIWVWNMGGMVVGRGNRSTRRKHVPSATLSTRIPYGPPWYRNWLHAVRLLLLSLSSSSSSPSSLSVVVLILVCCLQCYQVWHEHRMNYQLLKNEWFAVNCLEYCYAYDIYKRTLFWIWWFLYVMLCVKSAYVIWWRSVGSENCCNKLNLLRFSCL